MDGNIDKGITEDVGVYPNEVQPTTFSQLKVEVPDEDLQEADDEDAYEVQPSAYNQEDDEILDEDILAASVDYPNDQPTTFRQLEAEDLDEDILEDDEEYPDYQPSVINQPNIEVLDKEEKRCETSVQGPYVVQQPTVCLLKDVVHQQRSLGKKICDQFVSWIDSVIMISFTYDRACRKMFKSHQSIVEERQRQMALPVIDRYVIHPYSNFRMLWDASMVLLLAVLAITTPVAWAFYNINNLTKEKVASWSSTVSLNGDVLFILDIILNLRSGYVKNIIKTCVVLDSKMVAKRYLRTYFIVDMICTVPGSMWLINVVALVGGNNPYTSYLEFLRIIRLIRLYRYTSTLPILINLRSVTRRFITVVISMVLLLHWNACLQYLVANITGFKGSWVAHEGLVNEDIIILYFRALFRTISQMLCIGYGEFNPETLPEIGSIIVSMFIGAICYALFLANLNHLVMLSDTANNKYDEVAGEIQEYMALHRLPIDIRSKVQEYVSVKYNNKYFDTKDLLQNINPNIKKEMMYEICRDLVCKSALFAKAPRDFVLQVCEHMEFEIYLPGDVIVREGEKGSNLYFIEMGEVACILADGTTLAIINDGGMFGEIAMLRQTECTCDVISIGYTSLYYLSYQAFKQIIEEFPEMKAILLATMDDRLLEIENFASKEHLNVIVD